MISTVFLKSSTGFVVPYNDKYKYLLEEGADQIHTLIKSYQSKSPTAFGTRVEAIELAKAFFDVGPLPLLNGSIRGLKNFLIVQYKEGEANGLTWLHYQFLLDTVNYLRTGYRRVSGVGVRELLVTQKQALQSRRSVQNTTQKNELREKLREVIHSLTPEEDVDFLSIWLNQSSGMGDLTMSLYAMFGRNDVEEHLLGGYVY